MHRKDWLERLMTELAMVALLGIITLLSGCEAITDTNQTFAIHTGSVSGDPCMLTDCSAECDKYKYYIVEAPGTATMGGPCCPVY